MIPSTPSNRRLPFLAVCATAALLLSGLNVLGQRVSALNLAKTADLEIVDSLEVGDFIPPAAKSNVVSPRPAGETVVRSRMENGKTLRVIRAESSSLPELAVIKAELERKPSDSSGQVRSDAIPQEEMHRFLSLGATVIDRQVSHVTWMDSTGKMAQALCGFDISLLAGVANFRRGDTHYSIHLMHGQHDSQLDGRFLAADFAETLPMSGEIILLESELAADDETLGDLRELGHLIAKERDRLVRFQKARSMRLSAARRWHEANPQLPSDEAVVLRPHSGSRYLRKPEEIKNGETTKEGAAE